MTQCPCCGDAHPPATDVCPRTQTGLTGTGTGGVSIPGGPCGSRIDRYEVEKLIGNGGMGSVYRARHSVLGQTVALKLLHPELARRGDMLERFLREARAAASIGNPHIIRVSDCGLTPTGSAFLVMDLLHGESLEDIIARERHVAVPRAVDLVRQILDGLGAAHDAGIVHRDMKPANVFVTRQGDGRELVTILDFGISKVAEDGPGGAITRTGMVIGTPRYMAPEQLMDSRSADHRADLYAVGVILYQMFTGTLPYDADHFGELIVKVATALPRPLRELAPEIPIDVVRVVERAMAREPAARWSDARAFSDALRAAVGDLTPASSSMVPSLPPAGVQSFPPSRPPTVATAGTAAMAATAYPYTPTPGWVPPPAMPQPSPYPYPYPYALPMAPPPVRRSRVGCFAVLAVALLALLAGGGVTAWFFMTEPEHPTPLPRPVAAPRSATNDPDLDNPTISIPGLSALTGMPAAPVPIAPTAAMPVTFTEPQVVGETPSAPFRAAMERARPAMNQCRRPGRTVTITAMLMVSPDGTIPFARAGNDNTGDVDAANCVAARVREQVHIDAGTSGIVTFTATLLAR